MKATTYLPGECQQLATRKALGMGGACMGSAEHVGMPSVWRNTVT